MGGGGLAKSSYNFYSGWKSLFTVSLAQFTVYVSRDGWLKTSKYRHKEGEGLKLLKKASIDIWTTPFQTGFVSYDYLCQSIQFFDLSQILRIVIPLADPIDTPASFLATTVIL